VTTYVLDPATAAPFPGLTTSDGATAGATVTRRHLDATGVGEGWRCLVVGGDRSVADWLQARVGGSTPVDLCDPVTDRLPSGPYDLVHARLAGVHPLDRTRVLEELVGAVRPGGWVLVEDALELAFDLPTDGMGASTTRVTEAIRAAADKHGADLQWTRRVPEVLRDRACTGVIRDGLCAVGPAASAAVTFSGTAAEDGGTGGSNGDGVPVELEAFRWLLVDPYRGRPVDRALAGAASVRFFTVGRR
jgi:hypothetical protein